MEKQLQKFCSMGNAKKVVIECFSVTYTFFYAHNLHCICNFIMFIYIYCFLRYSWDIILSRIVVYSISTAVKCKKNREGGSVSCTFRVRNDASIRAYGPFACLDAALCGSPLPLWSSFTLSSWTVILIRAYSFPFILLHMVGTL